MAASPDTSLCPFCNESARTAIFYETPKFLAIYNIAPVLPGHSLVISRAHHISLLSLTEQEMNDLFSTARTVLQILMKAFHTDAFDWSLQEKPEAGQTIEHLHLHIVPRVKNDLDSPGHWYPLVHRNDDEIIDSADRPRLHPDELRIIVEKLKETYMQLNLK